MSFTLSHNVDEFQRGVLRYPDLINRDANRGMTGSVKSIGQKMARGPHARGGSFHVRSKNKAQPKSLPVVKLARKAAVAGWRGTLQNWKQLEGKYAEFRTANPLLLNREFGARLYPDKQERMRVGIRAPSGRIIRELWKRSVYIPPRLGARAIINLHVYEHIARMRKSFQNGLKNIERADAKRRDRVVKQQFRLARSSFRRIAA